jgi:hypothetical protein
MSLGRLCSSTAAALRQLVMFVVDKVVEEDRRMLLVNELESITLLDTTTQAFRDAFAIFKDLCLLDNGGRPQFYNSSTSMRRLLSS